MTLGFDLRVHQQDSQCKHGGFTGVYYYLSSSELCYYLVGVVEEVNRYTEWQGVMIGIPQQDRQDLHSGWPGLPLALLLGPLHGALAVDGILTHLSPNNNREITTQWYLCDVASSTV